MSIDQLAGRVFATRDFAHKTHLATGNYARHMALGDFYDEIIDEIDEIVECYQGQFDLIRPVPAEPPVGDPVKVLQADVAWINANRQQITKGDSSLANLLDGLVATYQRTLYKLRFLS